MGKVFKIFVRDLKRLLKNPVAIIVTIGVAIIPSLYAWFNILANWDPYENTSTVPIAVCIQDEGAEISDMGLINAGDMIRERLEENTQLGWQFVDDQNAAVEGVEAGTYYAAFIIPADFTSTLADVLDGNTNKAHIAYYVNEKVNAVSPKVTDTGSTTLENQISNEFVDTVGKVVVEKLQGFTGDTASTLNQARDSVAADLREVSDSLTTLSSDVSGVRDSIQRSRDTISSSRQSISELSDGATRVGNKISSALDDLAATRTSVGNLASQLTSSTSAGAQAISGVSATLTYDISQMTGNIGWAQGQLDSAVTQISVLQENTFGDLRTSLERLKYNKLEKLDDSVYGKQAAIDAIDAALESLSTLDATTASKVETLKSASDAIKQGNDGIAELSSNVNDVIQTSVNGLNSVSASVNTDVLPAVNQTLDTFAVFGGQVVGTTQTLPAMLAQADATLESLDAVLAQCDGSLENTSTTLASAAEKVTALADDVSAVAAAETFAGVSNVLDLDAESVGDFLGSPAELVTESIFPVDNYGSGVAPFYTNLALWVGGFVLVAIYKLEVDDEQIGDFKPWQGFFGRWLLLNLIGQLQAIICCIGDICLGMQCLSPVAFVFAGMVESFVYVFFIYAFSIAFKHIGKALCVLLVVLQIPGASGTYPIEMQPGFFQALNPWLPFTYGINAMREAIAGFYGNYYAQNLVVLLAFLIPALLIGVTARRHLLNINNLFDKKLAETDMMIAERTGMSNPHFRLSTIVKALMDSETYKETFLETAARFELAYPVLIRRGFAALIIVPLVLLGLMFVHPAKFLMLMLWVLSLLIICTFLIVVEYFHNRVGEKTRLAEMSKDELYDMLSDELKEELLAFAPIEEMRRRKALNLSLSLSLTNLKIARGKGNDENDNNDAADLGAKAQDAGDADKTAVRDRDGKGGVA